MTGEEMREEVRMIGKPKMLNFKFLVDVFPFQENRHWHFTAGFYLGSSKIGTALNDIDETSSLVAMNIYNRFYDRLKDYPYDEEPIFGDVYLSPETYEELMSYGHMGIHIGDFKDGTPYYMTPAKRHCQCQDVCQCVSSLISDSAIQVLSTSKRGSMSVLKRVSCCGEASLMLCSTTGLA